MKSPPAKGNRGEDFRTTTATVSKRENALLDALLRDVRARQQMVKSLLEDEEETKPLKFVDSVKITDDIENVATKIAKVLFQNTDIDARTGRPAFSRSGNPEDLFRRLRIAVEKTGVFVLLMGDLGSHHSEISENIFRGFAISDKTAPFIVINSHDAKAAYSFTLIHELVHIWLGLSGVSGSLYAESSSNRVEKFCNDVASELLLPAVDLKGYKAPANKNELADALAKISSQWCVSEAMVAYRFNQARLISDRAYKEVIAELSARWQRLKQKKKQDNKDAEGAPSYYVVKQYKLGNALVDVVRRTLRDKALTHTKAAKVLGISAGSVETLVKKFEYSTDGGIRR
jgi:Zn-dependent peptidase ImmA (M78 family)